MLYQLITGLTRTAARKRFVLPTIQLVSTPPPYEHWSRITLKRFEDSYPGYPSVPELFTNREGTPVSDES